MRVLGVDFGRRRIGLALSDETATLARPWRALPGAATPAAAAAATAALLREAAHQDETGSLEAIVVGLPRRLSGEETEMTGAARLFAATLARITGLDVVLQDERLSSHEAESRLAMRERDWRRRKPKLDAAAAAVILQDFLDTRKPASQDRDEYDPC